MADASLPPEVVRNDSPATDRGVRVMVVDDQEAFRSAMCELVSATEGFDLVGEAPSGEDALAAMERYAPDFVVMDARMPGMGGTEAAVRLLARYPDRVVLLVSLYDLTETPPLGPGGEEIPFVRKAELRRRVLRDVWEQQHAARLAAGQCAPSPAGQTA